MKVSAWPFTLVCWLCALVLRAPAAVRAQEEPERLLIVEATPADTEAAARLEELTEQRRAVVLRAPAHGDAAAALAWLHQLQASRAVVLDTRQRRVEVLTRDGPSHARQLDGEPTPYLMAFVATELLALEMPRAAAPPPAPAPAPEVSAFSRFLAGAGLEVSRPYTSAWLLRPKLALAWWVRAPRSAPRWRLALGADLAGPGRVERGLADEGTLRVVRWDTTLRLAAALPLAHWSVTLGGHGRAGLQHVSYQGVGERDERTVSLGFGPSAGVEWRVLRWLGLALDTDLALMPRRTAFTVHDQLVLRESFLCFSASLSLVFGTPPR